MIANGRVNFVFCGRTELMRMEFKIGQKRLLSIANLLKTHSSLGRVKCLQFLPYLYNSSFGYKNLGLWIKIWDWLEIWEICIIHWGNTVVTHKFCQATEGIAIDLSENADAIVEG